MRQYRSLLSLLLGLWGLGWGWGSLLGWSGLGWGGFGWGGLGWGGLGWSGLHWLWCWVSLLGGSLLLLEVLREELLISDMSLLGFHGVLLLGLLHDDLSSDFLLGNKSLDLWGLEESLVSSGKSSSDNVLSHIILSLSEDESLSDVTGSLWSESSWSLDIGESGDLLLSLNQDLEGDDSEVWSADASSA